MAEISLFPLQDGSKVISTNVDVTEIALKFQLEQPPIDVSYGATKSRLPWLWGRTEISTDQIDYPNLKHKTMRSMNIDVSRRCHAYSLRTGGKGYKVPGLRLHYSRQLYSLAKPELYVVKNRSPELLVLQPRKNFDGTPRNYALWGAMLLYALEDTDYGKLDCLFLDFSALDKKRQL